MPFMFAHAAKAVALAHRAVRRGDITLAERWFKIVHQAVDLSARMDKAAREAELHAERNDVPYNPR